ncbi:MAG: hypothetical protein OP8BY_2105 [Candidatus Saccharicenans subterraneus]|uniref:Uncharacterized protein n=1 Tax=Candidatus Saccharicenans subterraneus TaxID=2508984 RepID=A0A3E2BMZ4_9BACT|nr:MAG: hypothetical protein OP8BY_2105 [Candidatus Saccharicenans subterraneum]
MAASPQARNRISHNQKTGPAFGQVGFLIRTSLPEKYLDIIYYEKSVRLDLLSPLDPPGQP